MMDKVFYVVMIGVCVLLQVQGMFLYNLVNIDIFGFKEVFVNIEVFLVKGIGYVLCVDVLYVDVGFNWCMGVQQIIGNLLDLLLQLGNWLVVQLLVGGGEVYICGVVFLIMFNGQLVIVGGYLVLDENGVLIVILFYQVMDIGNDGMILIILFGEGLQMMVNIGWICVVVVVDDCLECGLDGLMCNIDLQQLFVQVQGKLLESG